MNNLSVLIRSIIGGKTLYRAMQNQELVKIELGEDVLDVAGGSFPSYRKILEASSGFNKVKTWTVADYLSGAGIDIVFDANDIWPILQDSYDSVVIINSIYIFNDPRHVLEEAKRVLKCNGTLILGSPFLWTECPEPFDYLRYTSMGLTRLIKDSGFKIVRMHGFGGRFTIAVDLLRPYLARVFCFKVFALLAYFLDSCFQQTNIRARMGYVVVAMK